MAQKKKKGLKRLFGYIRKKEAQYKQYKEKKDIAQMQRMREEIEKLKLQRAKFEEQQKLQKELQEARTGAGKPKQTFWNEAIFGSSK